MPAVDPDDDTIDRFVVRRFAYDPERHERRHIVVAAFDDEQEFVACVAATHAEIEARRAVGRAEAGEHVTGGFQPAGHGATQRARRAEWKRFRAMARRHRDQREEGDS